MNKSLFYIYFSLQLGFIKTSLSSLRLRAITYATLKHHIRQGIFILIYCNMVSESFRAYPSECLCWAYRATRYRAAIGPSIIYSPTHELAVSAWGGCVGDPTSTRDYSLSLYISGCKPQPHEPVLWGWVRLKVHFLIWVSMALWLVFISSGYTQ